MSDIQVPKVIDRADVLAGRGPGVMWTRALILEAAGFNVVEDTRKAIKRTRQALSAKTPVRTVTRGETSWQEGGEPDHAIRLKASELVFDLADVRKRRDADVEQQGRPVSVTLVLTSNGHNGNGTHAGAALPPYGVRLHLSSGDGG